VTYSIDAGWAKAKFSKWARTNAGASNRDAIYALQHMIKLTF
jgi:hypothetical protein